MANQSVFKIESNDLAIDTLFKDFYAVPDFQREYVWDHEHVDKLLQDVLDEFYNEDGRQVGEREYFLGSIVVCQDDAGIFQLIDGQQRMTTIYLVLSQLAIRYAKSEPRRRRCFKDRFQTPAWTLTPAKKSSAIALRFSTKTATVFWNVS